MDTNKITKENTTTKIKNVKHFFLPEGGSDQYVLKN